MVSTLEYPELWEFQNMTHKISAVLICLSLLNPSEGGVCVRQGITFFERQSRHEWRKNAQNTPKTVPPPYRVDRRRFSDSKQRIIETSRWLFERNTASNFLMGKNLRMDSKKGNFALKAAFPVSLYLPSSPSPFPPTLRVVTRNKTTPTSSNVFPVTLLKYFPR